MDLSGVYPWNPIKINAVETGNMDTQESAVEERKYWLYEVFADKTCKIRQEMEPHKAGS